MRRSIRSSLQVFGGLCLAFVAAGTAFPIKAAVAETIGDVTPGKPYKLTISPVSAKRGQAAVSKVLIQPGSGYHLNKDYPTQIKLTLPEGVTTPKASLRTEDARKMTEQEAQFEIPLTSRDAGKKTVVGELRFAVCTETTCDPQKTPISIELNVSQ